MVDTSERIVHLIERQRNTQGERCHLLVTRQEPSNTIFDGYKFLAALLAADFFSTIVTTNTDDLLEKALAELGILPSAYRVLVLGRDPEDAVAIALDGQESGICIIKLPVAENVPFATDIQNSLRSYLSQNIVVVGYTDGPLRDVVETLSTKRAGTMYYVVPAQSDADILLGHIRQCHKQYENFLISGPEGEFVHFFKKLAGILLDNDHISPENEPAADGDQYTQKIQDTQREGEATDTSNGSDHSIRYDQNALEDQIDEIEQSPVVQGVQEAEPVVSSDERSPEDEPPEINSGLLEGEIDATVVSGDELIKTGPLTFDPLLDRMKGAIRQLPWPVRVDVLIVTVTLVELTAVLGHHPARVRRIIRAKTYYDLGYIGRARTAVVQANDMGPLDAHVAVDEGIRALSPRAVIMTGIAFGVRAKGQQIGDVLVSRLIHDYDSERVGTGANNQVLTQQRGTRVKATWWLLDRFNAGSHDWSRPPEIHVGSILSGSKLVDNREYQNALLHSAQDAIGGEMEGTGLIKAAERHSVGWLLVKGISDWGDGTKGKNKEHNQKLAAENAARFVLFVIGQRGFMRKP